MNRREGGRQQFVEALVRSIGAAALVPWPVYAEATLLLQNRPLVAQTVSLGRTLLAGEMTLVAPTGAEHSTALAIIQQYAGFGIDLPDAVCIAMAMARRLPLLTWDFRHARAVVVGGRTVELAVSESEFRRL